MEVECNLCGGGKSEMTSQDSCEVIDPKNPTAQNNYCERSVTFISGIISLINLLTSQNLNSEVFFILHTYKIKFLINNKASSL